MKSIRRALRFLLLAACAVPATAQSTAYDAWKASLYPPSRAADAWGIYNDFIAAQVSSAGQFNFGAFPAGGAATSDSNSFNLSYSWPSGPGTSFTTIRVDGVDYILGRDLPVNVEPANEGNASTTYYLLNDEVQIRQQLQIVTGPSSGRPDTIRIEYLIDNLGTVPHEVGVRIMIDTMLNGNDAAPFRIPGTGAVNYETDYRDAEVPSFWQAFQDLSNADIAAQGTLIGSDAVAPDRFVTCNWGRIQGTLWDFEIVAGNPTGDSAVAMWWNPVTVRPRGQRVVATLYGVGSQSVASGALRLGVTAPTVLRLPDEGSFDVVATVENTTAEVAPGVAVSLLLPIGLALDSRQTTTVQVGDLAPGQSAQASWSVVPSDPSAAGDYDFTVRATSTSPNIRRAQVTRTITLVQAGPAVLDPEQCAVVSDRPTASIGEDGRVGLTVLARDTNGAALAGVSPERFHLTAAYVDRGRSRNDDSLVVVQPTAPTDADGATRAAVLALEPGTVRVSLEVDGRLSPNTATVEFVEGEPEFIPLMAGLNLISIPFATVLSPPDPRWAALQPMIWDPLGQRYVPIDPVGDGWPGPGVGLWVRSPVGGVLELVGTPAVDLDTVPALRVAQTFELPLVGAWNLLGNPCTTPLFWNLGAIEVKVDGQSVGRLSDPATWQYVDPYAWQWIDGRYDLTFDLNLPGFETVGNILLSAAGFWQRRATPDHEVTLVLHLAEMNEPVIAEGRAPSSGAWAVTLTASVGGQPKSSATVGVNARLSRALAIVPPPGETADVRVEVLGPAGRLRGEIRSGGGPQTWPVVVTSPAGADVDLAWPGLGRQLPAGYSATLKDLTTGRAVSLNTRSVYRYRAGGGERRFELSIDRRNTARLQVNVAAAPGRSRSASFAVTLNAPADVRVRVVSLTGRTVRDLGVDSLPAGTSMLSWDGRDDAGRRVPAGIYRVLVTAADDVDQVRTVGMVEVR